MQPAHFAHWPPGLPHALHYPRSTLCFDLQVSAARHPDRTALVFYGRRTPWRELADQVEALAAWLHAQGVRRGDRVLVCLQNAPQFVVAFHAVLRACAVVVPVNPMSREEELRHFMADSGARLAIVAQDTFARMLPLGLERLCVATYSEALPEDRATLERYRPPTSVLEGPVDLPEGCTAWRDALAQGAALPAVPDHAGPDDLACLPYTSGSTGAPKGCMHTHATMMATCVQVTRWKQLAPESVSLATAPFFHVTGLTSSLNAPVHAAAASVILPRWDAVVAARLIEDFGVTNWTNVPTMVVDLLSQPEAAAHDLSSLRQISGGGSAMPAAIAARLKERFGLDYVEGYGMSEFMSATHMNPPQRPKPQCLGIPAPDVEACVVEPGTDRVLPAGEQGEIVMRGPQQMLGYWNQPQATRDSLVDIDGRTFFRTGDLGHVDEDGYFFLSDRLKRMINASGFKVWPAEVENFFYRHPGIQECCVVASPDARRGETVKLVAVRRAGHEGLTEEALVAWAREHMAAYKVPRVVQFTDALPRTSSGKLFWRRLQDLEYGREP